jgi:hypothetical protein
MIGAVVGAGVGSVGALLVQGPYVAGRSLGGVFDGGLLAETFSTSYGRPLLLLYSPSPCPCPSWASGRGSPKVRTTDLVGWPPSATPSCWRPRSA